MNDKLRIKDVCSRFSSGKFISASKICETGEYPVYGGNGLRGYTDTFNFEGDCAVIGRQGAYCGNVKYFFGKGYMTEHAIVAVANQNNCSRFLAYKFALMDLGRYAGQSAQPGLSVETLMDVEIDVPSKIDQYRIAEVLSTIDIKIDNNKAICSNLEAMAKLLYDYWFVQFDYPDENGQPYKSSGGKMVWNEDLKREIPEGWEVGNLYDIASFINGLACQNYRPVDDNRKLPVIKIGEMHNGIGADVEWARDDVPQKNIIDNGDILFSWSASLEVMLWNKGKGVLNQHIFKVVPQKYDKYYVYQQLAGYIINFVKMAEARKTTMGHITTDHLKQSRIPLPPIELSKMYGKYVEEIYGEFLNCSVENEQLASLRDFLLPMLMNGQVKVSPN